MPNSVQLSGSCSVYKPTAALYQDKRNIIPVKWIICTFGFLIRKRFYYFNNVMLKNARVPLGVCAGSYLCELVSVSNSNILRVRW